MSRDPKAPPFSLQASFDERDVLGARWWQESLDAPDARRRQLTMVLGALGLINVVPVLVARSCEPPFDASEERRMRLALELQREEGWAVGAPPTLPELPGAQPTDIDGNPPSFGFGRFGETLEPKQGALRPFAGLALFQLPDLPAGASLRAQLRPIRTAAMDEAHGAATGLAELLGRGELSQTTAIVLDLPGPESVAAAAALAERFDPVYLFDNWPHPRGVVPSHLTLAAALTYLPLLRRRKAALRTPTGPVFVLDANRLLPYRDELQRFDNRYVARLPGAAALQALGVQRVLYVAAPGETLEAADLNEDFVAYADAGLEVRMLTLADLRPEPGAPVATPAYRYGGSALTHLAFFRHYRMYDGPDVQRARMPGDVSLTPYYRPAPRPTPFTTRTILADGTRVRGLPTYFGMVPSYGPARASTSGGRSGSWGRTRSGWSGG